MPVLARRALVRGLAVAPFVPLVPPILALRGPAPRSPLSRDPFTLGVASGDPWATGVVLWTRLAPTPLAADGLGGMPRRAVTVEWQVAEDAAFRRPVRAGYATADPSWAHSLHVEVDGLRPGAELFYRFRAAGQVSMTGRTRTAPAAGAMPAARFAVASCANLEQGLFTAYRRLAEEEPDLVLHLGDYLYESSGTGVRRVREHVGGEPRTLAAYRRRHAQYRTDPDLQAADAAAPWAVVFDDHEVEGNWAGFHTQVPEPGFAVRRAAAFRAYYEHLPLRRASLPLRRASLPQGPHLQAYRRLRWGDLATIHLLDTRQHRDDQACGGARVVGCDARLSADRTMLGATQERWLDEGLAGSLGRWDLIAQQVFMGRKDSLAGVGRELAMDGWDGYPAARTRLLQSLVDHGVRNPVVLTGDVHRHYAGDLRPLPSTPVAASEVVTTSISSGGDGSARTALTDVQLAENPDLLWADSRRGYVVLDLAPDRLDVGHRVLDRVSSPGARARTAARFSLGDGVRGLQVS